MTPPLQYSATNPVWVLNSRRLRLAIWLLAGVCFFDISARFMMTFSLAYFFRAQTYLQGEYLSDAQSGALGLSLIMRDWLLPIAIWFATMTDSRDSWLIRISCFISRFLSFYPLAWFVFDLLHWRVFGIVFHSGRSLDLSLLGDIVSIWILFPLIFPILAAQYARTTATPCRWLKWQLILLSVTGLLASCISRFPSSEVATSNFYFRFIWNMNRDCLMAVIMSCHILSVVACVWLLRDLILMWRQLTAPPLTSSPDTPPHNPSRPLPPT